jgi:4-amino-4-deoxy-L-arabinose transferase-like glycosyltransferase
LVRKEVTVLALIGGVAALLRLWGIAFGLPYDFHADEPFIVKTAVNIVVNGDFNPHIFTWPPLFIYLNAPFYYLFFLVGKAGGVFPSRTEFIAYYTLDPSYFILTIRLTSVFFGVLSLLPLYLLGRRLGHPKVGLLAATLLAVSPLHVENSHFGKVDITLVFFILWATYFLYLSYLHRRTRDYLLFGLSAGLATAAKYPAGLLVIALFLLSPLLLLRQEAKPWSRPSEFYPLLVGLSAYLLAFFLGAPHIFLDFPTFWHDFTDLSSMTTIPWLGGERVGSRFVYYAKLLLVEDLGPLVGIFWVAGVLLFAGRKPREALVLLAFPALYYCFFGLSANVFPRYGLPLLPTVLLFVAYAVWWISEVGTIKKRRLHHAIFLLMAFVFVYLGAVRALRVGHNLSQADTRIIAKEWIEANIPAGSRIVSEYYGPPLVDAQRVRSRMQARQLLVSNEHWRDWLATQMPVTEPFYQVLWIPVPWPQEKDTAGQIFYSLPRYLADGTEFIIVDSMMYGRYRAAPEIYPLQTAFYTALDTQCEVAHTWNPQKLHASGPEIKMYRVPRQESSDKAPLPLTGEQR